MTKIKLMFLLVAFSLLLFGCSNAASDASDNYETISTEANYLQYDEERQLFDEADLVIVAETEQSMLDREHIVTYVPTNDTDKDLPPMMEDFYSVTSVTINEVLKQPKSTSFASGTTMDIIEPVSIIKESDKDIKVTTENYLEIEKNQKYVLYLKENTFGEYGIINMNNGRFNLETENEFNRLRSSGNLDASQIQSLQKKHKNIKKEVVKRLEQGGALETDDDKIDEIYAEVDPLDQSYKRLDMFIGNVKKGNSDKLRIQQIGVHGPLYSTLDYDGKQITYTGTEGSVIHCDEMHISEGMEQHIERDEGSNTNGANNKYYRYYLTGCDDGKEKSQILLLPIETF